MLLVPAGSFVLGRDFGPLDQQPAHRVFVDAFWLDETLVTVAAWRVYDEAVHRPTSAEIGGSGKTAFLGIGLFSGVSNILMLTGSFYMLEIYDRVLASRSIPTQLVEAVDQ